MSAFNSAPNQSAGNAPQQSLFFAPSAALVAFASRDVPAALRPVAPFIVEAQRALTRFVFGCPSESVVTGGKRVAMHSLDQAVKLTNLIEGVETDAAALICLESCLSVRDALAAELSQVREVPPLTPLRFLQPQDAQQQAQDSNKAAENLLVAEAAELLDLGSVQYQEGMRRDAYMTFHTACIFYRVLDSMVPALHAEIQERLVYAVSCAKQCSYLQENFVQEHFLAHSCSQFYDVHARKKLGKGSYGSVYLATHRATGDERAVKVMNVDRVTSYYLRKLHTEISILKEVDHPNIIKLQEVFFGRRSVYLVTDLCRGGELFELLSSGKNQGFVFREDRAASLLTDMLRAVKYLHLKGIVHRDLKLENFLFEGDSSTSHLVLIDFGLSKHVDSGERMKQRVGSCYYTAPEVLNGDYDFQCDLWSLGVICYMLLSGTPPFGGKTPDEIHDSTLTKSVAFPDRTFKHVSPVAVDFLSRLLVKDPTLRMTINEAFKHPFITRQAPLPQGISSPVSSSTDLSLMVNRVTSEKATTILNSLVSFTELSAATRLILYSIAFNISSEKATEMRNEFLSIDCDNTGTFSFHELIQLGRLCPYNLTEAHLRHIYHNLTLIDLEGLMVRDPARVVAVTGQWNARHANLRDEIQYREFCAALVHFKLTIELDRFLLVFDQLDIDGEGIVTASSLYRTLGRDLTAGVIHQLLTAVRGEDNDLMNESSDVPGLKKSDFEALWVELVNRKPYGLEEFCAEYQDLNVDPIQAQQYPENQVSMSCDSNDDGHTRGQGSNAHAGAASAGTGSFMSESADQDSATGMVDNASTSTASNDEHRGSSGNGFFRRPAASLKAAATSVFSFLR